MSEKEITEDLGEAASLEQKNQQKIDEEMEKSSSSVVVEIEEKIVSEETGTERLSDEPAPEVKEKTEEEKAAESKAAEDKVAEEAKAKADKEAAEEGKDKDDKDKDDKTKSDLPDSVQERFNKITKEKNDAIAEKDALLKTEEKPAESALEKPVMPKAADFDDTEEYDVAMGKYQEDLVDFKMAERDSKAATAAAGDKAVRRADDIIENFNKNVEDSKIKDKHPDFEEVMKNGIHIKDPDKKAMFRELILDSDQGPELAYQLVKNPEVFQKIQAMSPIQAAKEIAAIEIGLASAGPVKTSTTPDPLNPVHPKDVVEKNPENMTQTEYEAWRQGGKVKA